MRQFLFMESWRFLLLLFQESSQSIPLPFPASVPVSYTHLIIALTCRRAGSFLVGVIIAFVYGYGGMFAAGNMTLANLYPITASLGMVGYRSYDTAVSYTHLDVYKRQEN